MIAKIYRKLLSEKTRLILRKNFKIALYPLYLGNKFTCNCCGKSFRKFLTKGNIKRENAECPFCHSLERTRLLDFYLKDELNLYNLNDINFLHIAPEECLYKKLSKLNINYIDGDINPALARYKMDITQINYADDYFDIIVCSHVLGHIPDEAKAISELRRVLKPNGVAIIMTLINRSSEITFEDSQIKTEGDRLKNYGEQDLCRLHGNDFKYRLSNQGFFVEEIDYRKKHPLNFREKYRLGNGDREIIFHCQKEI